MTVFVQPGLTQKVQIGQESTPGSAGTANKLLYATRFEPADERNTRNYRGQGQRFDNLVMVEDEYTSFNVSGEVLYTEVLYIIEAIYGTVAPTTVGSNTKKRVYTPVINDVISPKTFTLQWGDANNANQATYGTVSDFGMKFDRSGGVQYSGTKGFAHKKTTGATFGASPAAPAQQPVLGSHLNYYIDTTSAGIGGTQVPKEFLDVEFNVGGVHVPYFAADRSQGTDFATVVNGEQPKQTAKITVAESDLSRTLDAALTSGVTYYFRVQAQGPTTEVGQNYLLQFDMALQLDKKTAWKTAKTVYAREFDFVIVEDAAWGASGTGMIITSQTLLASL